MRDFGLPRADRQPAARPVLADGCDADASGFGEPADAPYWRSTGGTARDRYGDHEGDGLTLGLGIEFRVCRLGFPR